METAIAIQRQKAKQDPQEEEDDWAEGAPLCERPFFNVLAGICIMVNAMSMGIETDVTRPGDVNAEPVPEKTLFFITENIFCLIFFVELCIRLYCLQYNFFRSGWNLLDFFLVAVATLDIWILTPIYGDNPDMKILAVMRLVRLLRLVRLVRLLRMFKELWAIVQGVINCIITLGWVTLLMVLLLYVCGIFTTSIIGHNDAIYDPYFVTSKGRWDHEVFFGTVSRSMFTLVQILTLESWAEGIARHVLVNQPWFIIFFLLFLISTSFGLMNMIVGVIVENTMQMGRENDDRKTKMQEEQTAKVVSHLRKILEEADEDGSGSLSLEEFEVALSDPEIAHELRLIEFPIDDPQEIFMLLDTESDGELSTEEFLHGCQRLKGVAKSKDLLEVQIHTNVLTKKLATLDDKLMEAADRVTLLDQKTRKMAEQADKAFVDPRERKRREMLAKGLLNSRETPGHNQSRMSSVGISDDDFDE